MNRQQTHWYPLRIVLSIWTSLYNAGLRLRNQSVANLSDVVAMNMWDSDMSPTGGIMRRTRQRLEKLRQEGCHNTLDLLQRSWEIYAQKGGLVEKSALDVVCLYSTRSFSGAVWDYQEMICYVPELRKVLGFKIRRQDFNELRLQWKSEVEAGRNPFVGVSMTILNCHIDPFFNRIRRGSRTKIQRESVHWLESPKDLLNICSPLFVEQENLAKMIQGDAELALHDYVATRFMNSLVLFRPVLSVSRLEHANFTSCYRLHIKIGGIDLNAELEDQFVFGPDADPERLVDQEVAFLCMLPVGLGPDMLRTTSLPLVALSKLENLNSPNVVRISAGGSFPIVSKITTELREAFLKPLKPNALKLIASEHPKLLSDETAVSAPEPPIEETDELKAVKQIAAPHYKLVRASELEPLQAKLLVLLSSDRNRIFPTSELVARARREGFSGAGRDLVEATLHALAAEDHAFENIYGDGWFLNPKVKVTAVSGDVSLEAVASQVAIYLKESTPQRLPASRIIHRICGADSRVKPLHVNRAITELKKKGVIRHDGKLRWYWNPASEFKKKPVAPSKEISLTIANGFATFIVNGAEAEVFADRVYAHKTRRITIYPHSGHSFTRWVNNVPESKMVIRELMDALKKGAYKQVEYTDPFGGRVLLKKNQVGNIEVNYSHRDISTTRETYLRVTGRKDGNK